jgi:hypothetical protein
VLALIELAQKGRRYPGFLVVQPVADGAVLSTVGLGGLGAGLTSLANGSGLNLWVLVTLIVGLGGLAGLIVTQRRLGDNAMRARPSSPRGRALAQTCSPHSSKGRNLDPVRDDPGRTRRRWWRT